MKTGKTLPALCLLLLMVMGCVKQEQPDCNKMTFSFVYYADGNTNVLNDYIEKIDLYILNGEGEVVKTMQYTGRMLDHSTDKVTVYLPAGDYWAVAVGNAYTMTQVINLNHSGSLNGIYIEHPAWSKGGKVTGHDNNYMGGKQIHVENHAGVKHEVITMYSSHIHVSVDILGLPAPDSDDGKIDYALQIENSNASTNFRNRIDEDRKGTCYPPLVYDPETKRYHTENLVLFRMDDQGELEPMCCEHVLKLTDKEGKVIAEGNLYDFIRLNAETVDITKQEAYLPIEIVFDNLNVSIAVPPWYVVDGEPEWK